MSLGSVKPLKDCYMAETLRVLYMSPAISRVMTIPLQRDPKEFIEPRVYAVCSTLHGGVWIADKARQPEGGVGPFDIRGFGPTATGSQALALMTFKWGLRVDTQALRSAQWAPISTGSYATSLFTVLANICEHDHEQAERADLTHMQYLSNLAADKGIDLRHVTGNFDL